MPDLPGTVQQATCGLCGFDIDLILNAAKARDFKNAGYDFFFRYVPRTAYLAAHTQNNLTNAEAMDVSRQAVR